MESTPNKKKFKGLQKVPQYQDLLKVELANAHKYLYLPERYVFTASHAAEASDDFEKALADFKSRHLSAMDDHNGRRRGDNPVIVTQTQDAPRAPASDPRPAAAPPPPPDYSNVIQEMGRRLSEQDRVRQDARDRELQDELSRIRIEAQRQAETSRVLAQATANLQGIPDSLRLLATQPRAVDPTTHLREAAANMHAQAATQHQNSMEFLRRNASQLASMTAEFGGGLARALDSFKPREEPVIVTPPQPPPPPDPDAGRIKKQVKKTIKPPPSRPAGSMPGSSTDHIRHGPTNDRVRHQQNEPDLPEPDAEPPAMPGPAEVKRVNRKPIVKTKVKKNTAPNTKHTKIVEVHEKLTKNGKKPVIPKKKDEEPGPEPHVPAVEIPKAPRKRKSDFRSEIRGVKRAIAERTGPPARRARRVSAHEI